MARGSAAWVIAATVLTTISISGEARGDWDYRNGFGYSWSRGELRLNLFIRPRYEYLSDDGSGASRSSFMLDLVGGRLRIMSSQRRVMAEVTGGMAGDRGILLDTFLQFRAGDSLAIRAGYFRLPFDEQTTHSPFSLRMTDRSVDVDSLGYNYDLGLELRGNFLRDGLVFGVSITNGEGLSFENANIDFLYSGRLALRFGRLFDWYRNDLIIGLGTSWNLEPWQPMEGVQVNRPVLAETLDITLQLGAASLTMAALYRYVDPGAYGAPFHALGWHLEAGVFLGDHIELATRFAHLLPDVGRSEAQTLEAGGAINAFADRNRIRVQLEYVYRTDMVGDVRRVDTHRAVIQVQALY
jgi:hypothetical protein